MSLLTKDGKKFLILDTETTSDEGDPSAFNPANRLLFVGVADANSRRIWDIEFSQDPYGHKLLEIQSVLDECDVIVAFNAKFDLHWLARYGLKYAHKEVWDLQYAEFCMSGQTWKMPDCDTACSNRGLIGKLPFDFNVEHTRQEWEAYLTQDLSCELELFNAQAKALEETPQLEKLIWWGSQDLKITAEMERNGLKYDSEKSYSIGDEILDQVALIDAHLFELAPWPEFNWASPKHVSAILYGGVFKYTGIEPFTFNYKDGRTKEKLKKVVKELVLERLVEPLKNTRTKDEENEYYSTDEGVLRKLKTAGKAKQIVTLLLKRRGLEKKVGTYYHGIPKLSEKMQWQDGLLHGQLNHCVAATGRLSSSKPNLQNLEAQMRQCVYSRFPMNSLPL